MKSDDEGVKLPLSYKTFSTRPEDCSAATSQPDEDTSQKKPRGWTTVPFIIGCQTFTMIGLLGSTANLSIYLIEKYNYPEMEASSLGNMWVGTFCLSTLLGAFIADVYLGRFRTITVCLISTLLGTLVMFLTAAVTGLRPAYCSPEAKQAGQCAQATFGQLAVLLLSLAFLLVGFAGAGPCIFPFCLDQFDRDTEFGRAAISSLFNWSYTAAGFSSIIAMSVVIYIQDSVSYAVGFFVTIASVILAIAFFFSGVCLYVHVPPEGSVFSGIAQAFVAAFRKRHLRLPPAPEQEELLYNPCGHDSATLPLTQDFSFLNKAAMVEDVDHDASPWHLCTVRRVEQAKRMLRIIPMVATTLPCHVVFGQQFSLTPLQSLKMDRHLGRSFEIPPACMGSLSQIFLVLFLPAYNYVVCRLTLRVTAKQRVCCGIALLIVAMAVGGIVEERRRKASGTISALWLLPQLAMTGVVEALSIVGSAEFYIGELPEEMRSVASAIIPLCQSVAGYVSSAMITLLREVGMAGGPKWVTDNIDEGCLDHFYYFLAVVAAVDLVAFVVFVDGGGAKEKKLRGEEEEPLIIDGI